MPHSLVDRQLVAQREDFKLQGQSRAKHGHDALHHSHYYGLHGGLPYRDRRVRSIRRMLMGNARH